MPVLPLHLQSVSIGHRTFEFTWDQGPLMLLSHQGQAWAGRSGDTIPPNTPFGVRLGDGSIRPIPISPPPSEFRQGDTLSLVTATDQKSRLKRPAMLVNHTRLTREIFPWCAQVLVPPPIRIWKLMVIHFLLLIVIKVLDGMLAMSLEPFLFAVIGLLGLSLAGRSIIHNIRKKAFLAQVETVQDAVLDGDIEKFLKIASAKMPFEAS